MAHYRNAFLLVLAVFAGLLGPSPGDAAGSTTARGPNLRSQQPAPAIPTYVLNMDVDTGAGRLTGHLRLDFTNRTGAPLRDVVLRLYPNYPQDTFGDGGNLRSEVSNVQAGGQPATFGYEASRTAVRIPLPAAAAPGAPVRVELDWSATFRAWERSDGSFPLPSYYPMLAVWSGGWRTDVTQFPDRVFADAAMYQATIAVPKGLTVISGGSTTPAGERGGKTLYQAAIGPAREFAFSVGRFAAARATHDGITVNVYHKPGDGLDAAARQVALHAAASVAVYNDRFGAYPYRELDFHLINARRGFDIGVEYPGLIYLLVNGSYTAGTRFVTAHEVAHQWFYGVVGGDIYREPWLDEGFAQWAPLLVEERFAGAAAAEQVYQQQIVRLARRSKAPCGLGITAYGGWSAYYAAVYGRCSQFLYTLRKELGDEAFFGGIQRYYAANKHRVATSADVRAAFEASSGRKLGAIFREWTGR